MSKEKVHMDEQSPDERIKNFDEVTLGLDQSHVITEAKRCVDCKNPQCVPGCPVCIDIPGFIRFVAEGKIKEGAEHIKKYNDLPAICGRVCQQEKQCELHCIRGRNGEPVAIGRIERFLGDYAIEHKIHRCMTSDKSGKKVAVVGTGPASLTCAGNLSSLGHNVQMFESLHKAGGVLVYGIPEFRLPKKIVQAEIDSVMCEGVSLRTNAVIGKLLTVQQILDRYDAMFIGCGAGLPYFMKIPGENLIGVYSANEFLTRSNLMKSYQFPDQITPIKKGRKVVVVGGGNTAMDSARVARRYGSDVTIVYRRSEKEVPARAEEVEHAKAEGIRFMLLTNPVSILGSGSVEGIRCIKMELGEADASGRRSPVPIEGSEFDIECDLVVMAVGQGPNPLITDGFDIKKDKRGKIVVDKHMRTSHPRIFAAGDIATSSVGRGTVIAAMGDGRTAAMSIDKMLKKQ